MLTICTIPSDDQKITTCARCGREVDLTGGGPYFFDLHDLITMQPVCLECAEHEDPVLALCGMAFGEKVDHYHGVCTGEDGPFPALFWEARRRRLEDAVRSGSGEAVMDAVTEKFGEEAGAQVASAFCNNDTQILTTFGIVF